MTADEYQALPADTAIEAARVEAPTASLAFDPNAPLPDLHIIRHTRSWEPAARHYRDLTEAEKAEQNAPRFEVTR